MAENQTVKVEPTGQVYYSKDSDLLMVDLEDMPEGKYWVRISLTLLRELLQKNG